MKKDETRYWTPYNNAELIKLKEGSNKIVLKLLKRTDQLKFCIGLRKYAGRHWHQNQWYSDFISVI